MPFAALIETGNAPPAAALAAAVAVAFELVLLAWVLPHPAARPATASVSGSAASRVGIRMIILRRPGGRSAPAAVPGPGTGTNRPSSEDSYVGTGQASGLIP